ncbi:Breast cancer type 2 susceptibility protein like protein [Eufriesea mexicana]|uniref:Breast cancer type 2 susceptibility protein like protein n=1 Tax=Eufriesea mexicana TaxID=516756 RepID=A0A310S783_9HYME|nr:Breast cancer type 2 susceptibility protein like protein [Eufriesea mexicana]
MNIDKKNDGLSFGFSTASGSSINVSEKALLKAKKLFADELEDIDNHEEASKTENEINVLNIQSPNVGFPNIGFQTASGQHVNVSNDALLKAKKLFQEEISEDFISIPELPKPFPKRKNIDSNDDVPLKKQTKSNQFKKLRFSNEFQVPKTVYKNLASIKEKENQSISLISVQGSTSNYDTDKLGEEIANVPSSPVIGGQFIPKRRKSTGSKKRSINISKHKKDKSVCINNVKELDINCTSSDKCVNKKSKYLLEKQKSTDEGNKCDYVVATDFGDTQLMLDFINQSVTILEKRIEATLEQDKQISLKQINKPKPTISKLYFLKKSNANRVSWKEISKGAKPIQCSYEELIKKKLPPEIMDITADNAILYKFRCADFYGQDTVQNNIDGIKLEDGACLILDENGYAGITEIKRSFLACPGVDPNLFPTGWVENHYKWIVWKLASIDRIKLGSVSLPRFLTPVRVMMELKYRYYREIDRVQRSALRKILEKDDIATKRIILCVSSITEYDDSVTVNKSPNQTKTPCKKLLVTDGWYSIQALIDQAMIKHIISGKVKVGTKLLTYGSELLNCDEGCSPLEIPENVCLKLHTNSTRRARWDTKLGYMKPPGPICIKLNTIYSNGGLIGKIKVTVARVYPILYHEKTSTGESIFRNTRCEEKANIIYEKECRSIIEAFYAKAEKYFHTDKRKSNVNTDSIDLAAIEWNEDCEKLSKEEFLSDQELEQLKNNCRIKEETFRRKLELQLQENIPPPRQVTPLLKIRIVQDETNAILSIWSPSEDVRDILKEGNYISVCNVLPSTKRGNELHLTASRTALFSQINVYNMNFPQRMYTALYDISKSTFTPVYGEFDTVGIVVCIGNEPYGMKNFQAVYLAYPHTDSQSSYLSILFWHGISSHGYAEILTAGSFIACSNLEWRRATSWNIPMAYCTERSTFTRNPRHNHLQQPFIELTRLITDANTYIETCAVEISEQIQKKLTQNIKTPENIPRVKDYQNNQNESSDYFQLPSLQKKKTWKDVDDNLSTWDRNSPTADVFCSSEIENITTRKVMQQWEAIENTLYEDGEQVTQTAILEECVQWRMQIPHLRIIGKNPFLTSRTNYQDLNINHNQIRSSSSSHNEDEFPEYSVSVKERKNSSKHKLEKTPQDEIFDMLYEYVISELFPNKENEIDSLRDDFNDVLQIRMAPIHSNKSSAKSTKVNWFEETIPLESRLSNNSGKAVEDHILPMRREIIQTYSQEVQKKHDNSMSNEKIKNEKHESNIEDKFFRPHTSRNKLGTVFNEKIVVSPVPYVLSTRESFSTVKTTPIKFMAQSLEVPIFQGMYTTL